MNAYDLAQAAVEAYGDRYAGEDDTTLSAIRSDALTALKTALNGFAAAAIGAWSSTRNSNAAVRGRIVMGRFLLLWLRLTGVPRPRRGNRKLLSRGRRTNASG